MNSSSRPRFLALIMPLLCLPLLAANCIPPADDDDDDDGNAQAMHRLWSAYCDLLTRCEAQWGKSFESKASCVATWDAMTTCDLPVGFVTADRYVQAEGERCIAWLNEASCDSYVFDEDAPEACDKVFGDDGVGAGQSCEDAFCQDGLYCEYSQTDGVCAVCRQPAGLDQACNEDYPYIPCDDGLFCDDSTSTCKALLADSTACTDGDQCRSGYCPNGTCAAPLARDAACTATDLCAGALVCRSGVCTDRVGTNEACTDSGQCYLMTHTCFQGTCRPITICELSAVGEFCGYGCVATAYCDDATSTCKAFTPLNQACSGWDECGPDAYCDWTTNVCLAFAGLGDPCSSGMCEEETYCDHNASTPVCVAPKANGQDCSYGMECQSTYCDDTTSKCAPEPACTMP